MFVFKYEFCKRYNDRVGGLGGFMVGIGESAGYVWVGPASIWLRVGREVGRVGAGGALREAHLGGWGGGGGWCQWGWGCASAGEVQPVEQQAGGIRPRLASAPPLNGPGGDPTAKRAEPEIQLPRLPHAR